MKHAPKSLWILLLVLGFAGILKATLPPVVIGAWTSANNLTQPRSNPSAVMLADGRILVVGGDGTSGPLQSAEFFATDGSVSLAAVMNVARSRHFALVLPDGRVLVGGGVTSGGGTTNSAEIYDPSADSWTQTNPMAEARANATAALLKDGRVLIAGGDNSGAPSNTLEVYDPASGNFAFAGTLSSPRTKHAMAVLADGRALIVGGFDGTNPLASSDIFDPSTGNVSAGPSLATPRFAHSATTLLDGTVVIVGGATIGNNGTVELASAEVFDPATGSVSALGTNLATARQGHQAFLLPNNNNVLLVGGTSIGAPVAASELFSPWQGTFAITGANVTPRSAGAGSVMQLDGLLFTAGGSDASGNPLASTELYAFPVVKTDASDYAPGSIVTITGSGWQPGETVTLTLLESPFFDTPPTMTAVADGNGNFINTQFSPDVYDVDTRFYLTAVGSQSGLQAQNTFTDAVSINNITVGVQNTSPVVAGSSTTYGTTAATSVVLNFNGSGAACTATLSASGLPQGATASFAPTSVLSSSSPTASLLTVGTTAGTPAGSFSFTVTATPGGSCGGNSKTANATLVVQNSTSLSVSSVTGVFGQTVNLSATLTSGSPAVGESGQTITFTLNGNAAGSGTTNGSGVATSSASLGTIPVGVYATGVQATFAGNGGILASTASNSLTISKAGTTTTITAPGVNPATNVGQAYTVSWTVTPVAPGAGTPTGTVNVSDGSDSCSAAVGAGGCSLTSSTAGSPKTLTATYSGDTNFVGSSGTQNHNVNKIAASTVVSSSLNPSVFGQSVTFTANVTGGGATPSGTIQFVVDGSNFGSPIALVAGSASSGATTSLTVAGSPHTVTAQYSGDSNYTNGIGSLSGGQVVGKASTTAAVTSDTPDPSVVGQAVPVLYSVSVTAPGSGTPAGNVQVTDGVDSCTATVAAGQCNLTLTTAGARSLTATYQGDPNFSASPASAAAPHQVNAANTNTALTLTTGTNPSVFGQALIFTATVTAVAPGGGTPAGNVNFYDGGNCAVPGNPIASNVALNGSGQATGSSSTLAVSGSPYSVLACYASTVNYNASSATLGQTVNKADTTAAITSDAPDPSTTTQQITVKFTVSVTAPGGGTISGTDNVSVTDGTDTCTGTVAAGQCNVTLTTAGTRTLKATYQGGSNYNASPASTGATHTVLTPATLDVQTPVSANQQGAPADLIVKAGDLITVVVPIKDNGGSDAQSVNPPTLVVNHTGTATATCGAGAGASQINSGTTHTYTYTCSSVSGDGTLTFTANGSTATGTDATSNQAITGTGTATSNSITVDDTQPDVAITPPTGNVSVPFTFNWSVADPSAGGVSSGVNASSCTLKIDAAAPVAVPCTSSNSSLVSGTHTVVVTGADIAGNTNSATRTYTLDNTPPLVIVTFAPIVHGQNGWYNAQDTVPVLGTVTANDSTTGGSNVTSITCTGAAVGVITGLNTISASAPVSVSAEGVNNISCQATDSAGNTGASGASSNTATIKIDTLAPAGVTGAVNRAADSNGWFNHAVTIDFTGTDGTSGIASCTSTPYSGPDSASASVLGHCTDSAGNTSADTSFNFKFDATPPTAVALSVTAGTAGANGWYTSDVTVHTAGTETVSGPPTCTIDQFQTVETAGTLFNGSCTNDAGLTANAAPLNVKLDKTGPTATLAVTSGTLGNNGFYTSDVTVHATGADSISNPVNCTADQFLATDTTGQAFSGSCTNDAGLTTNATDLTVKRDATPPAVHITASRGADHNGWYNHALMFTNPGTDSTSGIANCATPAAYSGPDSSTASVSASCTDNAGNVGNGSFDFMFDATAPTNVSGAPNRPADHSGWYNHAVGVVFTGTDPTAGIESCDTVNYSGPDTANASVSGTCTDNAGNTSAPVASSSFKFDSTPPTAVLAVTAGTPGAHGWYTSDVTVSTTGTDSISNPTVCTADQFQTAETAGNLFNGSCTNDAGLTANATALNVKLDKTAPTGVILTPTGTMGLNNWFTSDVSIQTSGTETISNPIVCTPTQSQTTDTTGQLFNGSCTNDAGLSSNASAITVKRDATPPVLMLAFTPNSPDGNNGWWKTPGGVPYNWTCSDATSGIDGTYNGGCPTPATGTDTTQGTTNFTGQVRDQAGNVSAAVNRDLKLDNVAPVVIWTPVGDSCSLPGNAGWCRATQTAAFTASDATSGLANLAQASFTQTTGTNGTAVLVPSGTVMDAAGNLSPGVNAGPYKIDSVAPIVTLNNPTNGGNYLLNASVAANYSCTDATSGVSTCAGPVANGANISTNPVGAHAFTVNATDIAGNPAIAVTNNYTITYSTGGMCAGNVGHAIRQPINVDGSSVFKLGSTVPTKFAVCDANGVSIGTPGVVTGYGLVAAANSPNITVDEDAYSTTPDTAFRWDPTGLQWIFNQGTKNNGSMNHTGTIYYFAINLNDGSSIYFQYGLK